MAVTDPVHARLTELNRLFLDIETGLNAQAGAANATQAYPHITNMDQVSHAFNNIRINMELVLGRALENIFPTVTPYRQSINRARKFVVGIFIVDGIIGAIEGLAPIQVEEIPDLSFTIASDTHDFSQYFVLADTYSITSLVGDSSFDESTGIYTAPSSGVGGASPLIYAYNSTGAVISNVFHIAYNIA